MKVTEVIEMRGHNHEGIEDICNDLLVVVIKELVEKEVCLSCALTTLMGQIVFNVLVNTDPDLADELAKRMVVGISEEFHKAQTAQHDEEETKH